MAAQPTTLATKGIFMNILEIINSVRQNHAMEHATIHVLSARYPYARMAGRSTTSGFFIYGSVPTQVVANAASEALVRLQQGESHLAVHPRCGTYLAVTSLAAGTAAFAASQGRQRSKLDRLPLALVAATIASVIAQPLAARVQEDITTTPELDGVCIQDVKRQERGKYIAHKITLSRG
jgi:hypothetical protein